MAMKKEIKLAEVEVSAPSEKILPLEHVDFNTVKEKLNEIISYLNQ